MTLSILHATIVGFMSTLSTALLASIAPPGDLDLVSLVLGASGVVLVVLFLLICLSVISWYVIGYKYFFLSRAHGESIHFLDAFWQAKRLDAVYQQAEQKRKSPLAQLFKAGYVELSKLQNQKAKQEGTGWGEGGDDLENVERALRRSQTSQTTQLESMVPFLATVGSAAPFIGLFGTVWGIMDSFRSIGAKGSANLATVAPGIAEALITTAIGLVAAIPAVMAYNYFARKIKVLSAEMEAFSNDFLNIVKRHFLR